MLVNVSQFKLVFCESGSIEFKIQSPDRQNKGEEYATSIYLLKGELPVMLQAIEGKLSYSPVFRDISYYIQFDGYSIHTLELRDSRYTESYFYLPLSKMEEMLNLIVRHIESPVYGVYELSGDEIASLKEQYAPQVEWVYNHDLKWIDGEYRIIRNVKDSLDYWSGLYPGLGDNLKSLVRIASGYSIYGEIIKIHIFFDCYPNNGRPDSYYFDIRTLKNERIMNGGLICHSNNNGTFTYSMHT